jgi:hypothetical protein
MKHSPAIHHVKLSKALHEPGIQNRTGCDCPALARCRELPFTANVYVTHWDQSMDTTRALARAARRKDHYLT